MVSIIKNQILKHLSKFTKNLSTDQFNFSTLKGEGELKDLELDETVLTDLLELPSWLRLTSAWCNRVSFRIQWAKLKSVPINLSLDEVHVEVETCEELRSTSSSQGLSSYAGAAKYSFIHKVIDGMTVTVNTVLVKFKSPAFTSSVELSRILVESRSPESKKVDLPGTRIKDASKNHVLLFKELEWQNVRIEARSTRDPNLTPLRLITNKATCKIVLKKRIRDSFIMGSRLIIKLDDLLWVLTDYQLKAALHFLDSLAGLIKKATEMTRKRKAARKLEVLPEYQAQQSQQARAKEDTMTESGINQANKRTSAERFAKIDVIETSYHFIANKIDLHICDDNAEARSSYPDLQKGGSLQVSLLCFQVDFYPYHLAVGDRKYWPMYQKGFHANWLNTAQSKFFADLMAFAQANCKCPETQNGEPNTPDSQTNSPPMTPQRVTAFIKEQLSTLMTSCLIVRLADVTIYQVTTSDGRKHVPKEFIAGDKERHHISQYSPILQAEFTYYYYPSDDVFPLPTPKLCVHVDPIVVNFDVSSLLWLNSFALSLQQSVLMTSAANNDAMVSSIMSFDVQIEAINTRLVFDAVEEHSGQRDRPRSLQLQVSRASICNVRHTDTGFRTDLEACVNVFQLASLFHHSDFPSDPKDLTLQVHSFADLCAVPKSEDNPRLVMSESDVRVVLNCLPVGVRKEVWSVRLDPVSGSFFGAHAVGKDQAVAFLDNLPINLWVRLRLVPSVDVQVLAHISSLMSVQINHYQFLFLLRLSERLEDLTNYLSADSTRILKKVSDIVVVVGAVVPQLDVTLLMPSQTPGKSSSGGDMESFIPDSSSLQEDNWQSSSSMVNEKMKSNEHIRFSDTDTIEKLPNGGEPVVVPEPIKIMKQQSMVETKQKIPRRLSISQISFTEDTGTAIFRSFKKGVGNIMASLDMGNQSPDDMSSTLSLRSDGSTDSDGIVLPEGDPLDLFCNIPAVEEAAECIEDENTVTSPSEKDSFTNLLKRHDLVSICTFKLRKVELELQLQGPNSVVKVEVSNVGVGECPSIPWDEFQSKFNSRHRGWTDSVILDPGPRQIAVRLRKLENLENSPPVSSDVDARIRAIRLNLSVSSVGGIAELVEDELRPTPLPAVIALEDIRLRILDDRPATHITSVEPPPVDLVVHHLIIRRDASGLIEIPAPATLNHVPNRTKEEDAALKRLQIENEDLRRRLVALERLTAENYNLKKYHEETESLRPCLKDAQDRVETLLEDKQALLDSLRSLQHQLTQSERSGKR